MSDQTQTLEQTLNKTDLGHVLYEHRKTFLAALVAVLVVVTGYAIWNQTREASARENSVAVFEFQKNVWAEAQAGKVTPEELVNAFGKLDKEVKTAPVMIPLALQMSAFLYEKGAFAQAETLLAQVSDGTNISGFFVALQKAANLEKLNKLDEAIAVLEKLAQSKEPHMASKVYLELGRLYSLKGEKAKAQTQFDYIVNTFPNEENAKIAKLYLAKLAE